MFITVENVMPQRAQNGRDYFSFWAKIFFTNEKFISVSGFKYFPDTHTVSTPSVNKAKGETKFFNTSKLSAEMYNEIRQAAENAIDSQLRREVGA